MIVAPLRALGVRAALALSLIGCGAGASQSDGVCVHEGQMYAAGSTFPSAGNCAICGCRGEGEIACGLSDCLSSPCGFDRTYRYGYVGGLGRSGESILAPPAVYLRSLGAWKDGAERTCASVLRGCGSLAVDPDDIMRAIAHPDVQAALAQPSPPSFGIKLVIVDLSFFRFTREDGRAFDVGVPCGDWLDCVPIPEGIAALVEILEALDEQQRADPSCAALR